MTGGGALVAGTGGAARGAAGVSDSGTCPSRAMTASAKARVPTGSPAPAMSQVSTPSSTVRSQALRILAAASPWPMWSSIM
ncbi:MAG TPA: hypothetical protein PKA17_06065, partial [Phenylobacterium sp.]|nr:hypothetical protein [Phenylobacterium sp.]